MKRPPFPSTVTIREERRALPPGDGDPYRETALTEPTTLLIEQRGSPIIRYGGGFLVLMFVLTAFLMGSIVAVVKQLVMMSALALVVATEWRRKLRLRIDETGVSATDRGLRGQTLRSLPAGEIAAVDVVPVRGVPTTYHVVVRSHGELAAAVISLHDAEQAHWIAYQIAARVRLPRIGSGTGTGTGKGTGVRPTDGPAEPTPAPRPSE